MQAGSLNDCRFFANISRIDLLRSLGKTIRLECVGAGG